MQKLITRSKDSKIFHIIHTQLGHITDRFEADAAHRLTEAWSTRHAAITQTGTSARGWRVSLDGELLRLANGQPKKYTQSAAITYTLQRLAKGN